MDILLLILEISTLSLIQMDNNLKWYSSQESHNNKMESFIYIRKTNMDSMMETRSILKKLKEWPNLMEKNLKYK